MPFINKILAASASLLPFALSFAATQDLHSSVTFGDVNTAADDLVKMIYNDPNNNHKPVPGHDAYKDLALVSVDPEYSGTFTYDDATGQLTHVEVTSVKFQASGVPLFNSYSAEIKLSVDVAPDCKTYSNRNYAIVKSNAAIVDPLFNKDLTGKNYTKYAYADVVFDHLLGNDQEKHPGSPVSALRAYCK